METIYLIVIIVQQERKDRTKKPVISNFYCTRSVKENLDLKIFQLFIFFYLLNSFFPWPYLCQSLDDDYVIIFSQSVVILFSASQLVLYYQNACKNLSCFNNLLMTVEPKLLVNRHHLQLVQQLQCFFFTDFNRILIDLIKKVLEISTTIHKKY